jgi:hypothetical protein
MAKNIRYLVSPKNPPYESKESFRWGSFVRYIEFGDDRFPLRQVDEYENGHRLTYDRNHWADQFGTLADFRFGDNWVKNWGQPMVINPEEFEAKWQQATQTEQDVPKRNTTSGPPPWMELFESGQWQGQS